MPVADRDGPVVKAIVTLRRGMGSPSLFVSVATSVHPFEAMLDAARVRLPPGAATSRVPLALAVDPGESVTVQVYVPASFSSALPIVKVLPVAPAMPLSPFAHWYEYGVVPPFAVAVNVTLSPLTTVALPGETSTLNGVMLSTVTIHVSVRLFAVLPVIVAVPSLRAVTVIGVREVLVVAPRRTIPSGVTLQEIDWFVASDGVIMPTTLSTLLPFRSSDITSGLTTNPVTGTEGSSGSTGGAAKTTFIVKVSVLLVPVAVISILLPGSGRVSVVETGLVPCRLMSAPFTVTVSPVFANATVTATCAVLLGIVALLAIIESSLLLNRGFKGTPTMSAERVTSFKKPQSTPACALPGNTNTVAHAESAKKMK